MQAGEEWQRMLGPIQKMEQEFGFTESLKHVENNIFQIGTKRIVMAWLGEKLGGKLIPLAFPSLVPI